MGVHASLHLCLRRALVSFAAVAAVLLVSSLASAQGFPTYPGLQPVKEAASPTVTPGGEIVWTITIYNDAFTSTADIQLTDDVPDPADGLPVEPWSLADLLQTPPGSSPTYNGDSMSITRIAVAGGATEQIVFRTRVSPSAADGTEICNVAVLRYNIETCSGNPPLCGSKTYRSATNPPGGTEPEATCVTVVAPSADPDIVGEFTATDLVDSCPQDPSISPDGQVSPGETLSLTLAIQNTGATDAAAQPAPIIGTLRPGVGYTIVQGSSDYSTTGRRDRLEALGANVGTNDTPFVIRVDPMVACPGTLTLPLVVSQIENGPYTVEFDFVVGGCTPSCVGVSLQREPTLIGDECPGFPPNNRIDPGEEVALTIPVRNDGPDDLIGEPTLLGLLESATPGVTVISAISSYPDMPVGAARLNDVEYRIQVDETLACGTSIDLELTITGGRAADRVIPLTLMVASPCSVCVPSPCSSSAIAAGLGPLTFCEGGSVTLDASASVLTDCTGSPAYQWFEGGVSIAGANAVTYDVPMTLPIGAYAYSVEVSCSSDPSCSSRSADLDVRVDPAPLVVNGLLGRRVGADAEFQWDLEATATGGYRLYRTVDKTKIPSARGGTPGVDLVTGTAADPADTQAIDVGVVDPGWPDPWYHYQVVTVCSDGISEGPNL